MFSLLCIFLSLALLFVVNVALCLAGGYVMLFRTALNDKLTAKSKFKWMWVQSIFAPSAMVYAFFVEKNKVIGLTFGCILLAVLLALGFEASQVHWSRALGLLTMVEQLHAMKAAQKDTGGGVAGTDSAKPDLSLSDPVITDAKNTIDRLAVLQKSAADPAQQRVYANTSMLVGFLKLTATTNALSKNPNNAAQNQKIGAALADLNTRLGRGSFTQKDMQDWSALVNNALTTKP